MRHPQWCASVKSPDMIASEVAHAPRAEAAVISEGRMVLTMLKATRRSSVRTSDGSFDWRHSDDTIASQSSRMRPSPSFHPVAISRSLEEPLTQARHAWSADTAAVVGGERVPR
jgi:hypothetical protein